MSIELITGPMFGGKSTALIMTVKRYALQGHSISFVKPTIDERYESHDVVTHDYIKEPAIRCRTLDEADRILSAQVNVIGIDEGQFFPDLVHVCVRWATRGIRVVVAALNGTATQEPWPVISQLIPHCDKITFQAAVCKRCYDDAAFSARTTDATDTILIGGTDAYQSVCRRCLTR